MFKKTEFSRFALKCASYSYLFNHYLKKSLKYDKKHCLHFEERIRFAKDEIKSFKQILLQNLDGNPIYIAVNCQNISRHFDIPSDVMDTTIKHLHELKDYIYDENNEFNNRDLAFERVIDMLGANIKEFKL